MEKIPQSRSKRSKKSLGKYCVAGGPGNVSCRNNSKTEGVSMHRFPSDTSIRNKWTSFVQRHRSQWKPSSTSVLCSAHFQPSDFEQRLDFKLDGTKTFSTKRWLKKGTIPSVDCVVSQPQVKDISARERRQIIRTIAKPVNECVDDNNQIECKPHSSMIASPGTDNAQASPGMEFLKKSSCENCGPVNERLERLRDTHRKLKYRHSMLRKEVRHLRLLNKTSQRYEESESEISEGGNSSQCTLLSSSDFEESEEENETQTGYEKDEDWVAMEGELEEAEFDTESENEVRDRESKSDVKVEPGTKCQDEPKFIVFYTALLSIFSMFCFKCKGDSPEVRMKKNGTMVTVEQQCKKCWGNFTWSSQPFVLGNYPAGNMLLSFSVLMSGASISKLLLVFKHFGIQVYKPRTFFYHQSLFLFPAIQQYWESYQSELIQSLKCNNNLIWSGDGRFDSMGHSAKYGAYTMMVSPSNKIVHFELLQANQTGSSTAMELEAAKLCFDYLHKADLEPRVFVSDRHRGIAKWIRESLPNVTHYFDQWHVKKGIVKKMLAASKKTGCERIAKWITAAKNHIYWCSTTTKEGFQNLIVAKWKSLIRHVSNKHTDHPDPLFKECAHGDDIERRKWIKVGTVAYESLHPIVMKKSLLNDIKKLCPYAETSCLEGFHSTLNQWHAKMKCSSWLGTFCRHVLASLHFNENVRREKKKSKDGSTYVNVTYPKFKSGKEVVREVAVEATYGYVDRIKAVLFGMTKEERKSIRDRYKAKVPLSLTSQFTDKTPKSEAIKSFKERKTKTT